MWTRLFAGQAEWQPFVLALGATVLLAWFAARVARRLATAALRTILKDTLASSSPLVRRPLRLVGIAAFILVTGLLLFPAFELAGLHPRTGIHLVQIAAWTFGSGLRVTLIAIIGYALVRTTHLMAKRFEHEVSQGAGLDAIERAKRARTLGAAVSNVATFLIIGIAILMVLREFQIDIAPVLTGAGIAGLAVGFGAQTLVRDIISGFFLILEDQVRVGDSVTINGVGGLVEVINLRTIILRDGEGAVHVYPNGSITTLANRSKDFSYYVIDLPIPYGADPDAVTSILRTVGEELQRDRQFGPFILEPLQIFGVDSFADWSVVMKMRIKTTPLKQWEVGRELRKRIRRALAEHHIEVPYPGRLPPPEESGRGGPQ
jgi:moderate conductance mechanosensitive channel